MKHVFKFPILLLSVLVSLAFWSCSFLNITGNVSSIEVRLPHRTAGRSVYAGNGFSANLSEDGKFNIDDIDEYEVVITSSTGISIPKTVPADENSIFIPDVEVGEWSVTFTAYAVDEINGKKVRTVIAKTREPVKTTVKADKPSVVEITAERVKYFTADSKFENCGSEIGMNISSVPFQLKLSGDYILPVSELINFEVQSGDGGIVEVTKDGLIIPKKSGTTTIAYSRLQDEDFFGGIEVTVFPVVKINCFVNGVNVSGKYPLYTKIIADNGDLLSNALSNYSLYTIMTREGLDTCDWYFDSDYKEPVTCSNSYSYNLYDKYNELEESLGDASTVEINLYADQRRRVQTLEELKTALTDGGSGDIIFDFTCTLPETLGISIAKNVRLYGTDPGYGFNGDDKYHVVITGDNTHSLELVNLTFQNGCAGQNGRGGIISATKLSGIRFKNCNFEYNKVYPTREDAGGQGGSIYLKDCSSVSVEDCGFLHNGEAALCSAGGFIYVDEFCSDVVITDSKFTGGFANHGGALGLRVSSTVKGCTFENNQGYYRGGGINIGNGAVVKVENCTFMNNKNEQGYDSSSSDVYTCNATAIVSGCVDGSGNAITYSTCHSEDSGGITIN
ncbi:right-handed parallel beta-helix repeat-containing protein [Treponema sp.]|uniref:right-handed parallel beta-helix repeat-containing protein n=1 Tax=Treponema sp. TaxID=166 RepID=UPI00298DA4F0|nr:hypothetical protein [Treponema sp.]